MTSRSSFNIIPLIGAAARSNYNSAVYYEEIYCLAPTLLLWLVAFILALLTAGFFISQVYKKWDVTPVIVTIGTRKTRVDEIPFPAITLCPSQLLQKKVGKQLQKPKFDPFHANDSIHKAAVDWHPDRGYPPGTPPEALPYRILKGTPFAGVNILINSFDDVAYGNYIDVDLFIMIHSPLETPNMKIPASLRIERQQYYNIKITPSVTVSEKSLTSLDIKRRQCFFSSDKYLKFFKSYTQKNCFTECLINATLRECGCVPYYLRSKTKNSLMI
ncbi:pickpocket protein 28-like [Periplaneta americana]|uniref:pickpocket protein 28-like n=1 Tax=Periplaneta americana TaxID=6978 RepID=UPI0037E79F16